MAKKQKIVVTEGDFQSAFSSFKELVTKVTGVGSESGRPRFSGFKILDSVKDYVSKALEFFKTGDFALAMAELREARNCITNTERAYARNSADKFFLPMLCELNGELEEDLWARIAKRLREFDEIIGIMKMSNDVDMNEVSQRYWTLLEAIENAPVEQQAREHNRERYAVAKRRKLEQQRDEESRQAQAEADERKRAHREVVASELEEEFASMF